MFVPFCPCHLAGLIDDFICNILSIPFCSYHFVHAILSNTILSVPFCPYHFVRYHFVLEPITPLLRDVLHWLPVPFRIKYKLCLFVFLSLHGAAPEYLRGCCIGTHSSASGLRLRSPEKTDLRVRRMRTHFGDRAFSAAGPRCWNNLLPAIRLADSVDSFNFVQENYFVHHSLSGP